MLRYRFQHSHYGDLTQDAGVSTDNDVAGGGGGGLGHDLLLSGNLGVVEADGNLV